MKIKIIIIVLLFLSAGSAVDSGGTKFRLNIGGGGAYLLGVRYQNQFGSSSQFSYSSNGSVYPTLNVGYAFTQRLSLFFRYSHFLVLTDQPDERIQQYSCFSLAADIVPSKTFSRLYLSFSLGYLQYWEPKNYYSYNEDPGISYHGIAFTSALGYRLFNHLKIQGDLACLINRMSTSITRTYIDPNDNTNTIRVLGTETFSDTWYNILIGLSAFWDIF